MRDITTVIDRMLEVIPKNPSTSNIRVGLNSIKDSAVLTHKGNCNNPIHIYNKEIQ